jgi:hypothetical protein
MSPLVNALVSKMSLVNAEKTKCHLKSSAKFCQVNGRPCKSLVFFRVSWTLDSKTRGFKEYNNDNDLLNVAVVVIVNDFVFLQNVKITAVSTWSKS